MRSWVPCLVVGLALSWAGCEDLGGGSDGSDGSDPSDGSDLPEYTLSQRGRYLELSPLPYPGLLPRGATIYLPAAYALEPDRRFGVLYLHDGQNLFDPAQAAFGMEWQVDEALDLLTAEGAVPPTVVVGVHNTAERLSDYTPDADPQEGGGNGDRYTDFLVEALKPIIDRELRTLPDRDHTALGGSSLGGIISLHACLRHPQVFGRVAGLSPSLWWNGGSPTRAFADHTGALPERLWLDMGTAEGDPGPRGSALVEDLRELCALARSRGLAHGTALGCLEDPLAVHDEQAWAARLPGVLTFLLGEAPPPPTALSVFVLRPRLLPATDTAESLVAVEASHGRVRLTWPDELATISSNAPGVMEVEGGVLRGLAPGQALAQASLQGLSAEAPVWVGDDGQALVRFAAHVPLDTPGATGVWVSGDLAALGAWSGAGLALRELHAGLWLGAVELPPGAGFLYKYTRGDWATVEKAADGSEIGDRAGQASGLSLTVEDWIARWADR